MRKPCCNSENYFHLHFHCSHLPILSLLFRILYQRFPSLRIYLPLFDLFLFPLTYFYFSHIVSYLFAIDILGDRCKPTIGALFVLLPFNVYVSPTPSICCARQNIKLSPLLITSFLYAYFSMFTNLYLLFPLMFTFIYPCQLYVFFNYLFQIMLSLFFLSLIVSTSAFEVTLCDCTKHTGIGLLTFSDGD